MDFNEKITNPHDKLFKQVFSEKEQASEFLEKTSPEELVQNLNLPSLTLDTTNYIDENLKENFSDVVYNCDYSFWSEKSTNVKIIFLLEHKSYRPEVPYLQINRYMLNVWETQLKQTQETGETKLSPIVPIIFYHGKSKWNAQPFKAYFEAIDDILLQYLPKFDYHLVNTANYDNQKIKQLFERPKLRVTFLLFRNIFREKSLLDTLKEIYGHTINLQDFSDEEQFFKTISYYIFSTTHSNLQEKLIEIMKTLQTKHSDNFVSLAEGLLISGINKGRQEGRKEGRQEGRKEEKIYIAINMILQGLENQIISQVTGLPETEIQDLRNAQKN